VSVDCDGHIAQTERFADVSLSPYRADRQTEESREEVEEGGEVTEQERLNKIVVIAGAIKHLASMNPADNAAQIKRFAKAVMTLAEYPPPSWGPQIKRDIDDVVDEAARINAGGRI